MVNTLSNTGGPLDWFQALPKITRTYAISTVVVAAMISWNLPGVSFLLLQWPKVWPGLQVCSPSLQACHDLDIRPPTSGWQW